MASSQRHQNGSLTTLDALRKAAIASGLPSKTTTVINSFEVALQFVAQAASAAPVPFLKQAASSALILINIGQKFSDNSEDLKELIRDVTGLVAGIYKSCLDSGNPSEWLTPQMQTNLAGLVRTLQGMQDWAKKLSERKFFMRILKNEETAQYILAMRRQIRVSIMTFDVQSHIAINSQLYTLQAQMPIIRDAAVKNAQAEKLSKEPSPPEVSMKLVKTKASVDVDTKAVKANQSKTTKPKTKGASDKAPSAKAKASHRDDRKDSEDESSSEPEPEKKGKGKKAAPRRKDAGRYDGLHGEFDRMNLGRSSPHPPQDYNYYDYSHPSGGEPYPPNQPYAPYPMGYPPAYYPQAYHYMPSPDSVHSYTPTTAMAQDLGQMMNIQGFMGDAFNHVQQGMAAGGLSTGAWMQPSGPSGTVSQFLLHNVLNVEQHPGGSGPSRFARTRRQVDEDDESEEGESSDEDGSDDGTRHKERNASRPRATKPKQTKPRKQSAL